MDNKNMVFMNNILQKRYREKIKGQEKKACHKLKVYMDRGSINTDEAIVALKRFYRDLHDGCKTEIEDILRENRRLAN